MTIEKKDNCVVALQIERTR